MNSPFQNYYYLYFVGYNFLNNVNVTIILFSMISTNDCCCDIIESSNVYKTFISLFGKYTDNEEIIVRLTFTLGNIVAKIDNTRVKVCLIMCFSFL